MRKTAKPFLEQDRPEKVKEIYRALKRDHPDMPAEMKARIALRRANPDPAKRKSPKDGGPSYKGPITEKYRSVGKEVLVGGKADGKPDASFDPKELRRGRRVEREHTSNRAAANEVAKDHLTEDRRYYAKLQRMEKKAESRPAEVERQMREDAAAPDPSILAHILGGAAAGAMIGGAQRVALGLKLAPHQSLWQHMKKAPRYMPAPALVSAAIGGVVGLMRRDRKRRAEKELSAGPQELQHAKDRLKKLMHRRGERLVD